MKALYITDLNNKVVWVFRNEKTIAYHRKRAGEDSCFDTELEAVNYIQMHYNNYSANRILTLVAYSKAMDKSLSEVLSKEIKNIHVNVFYNEDDDGTAISRF